MKAILFLKIMMREKKQRKSVGDDQERDYLPLDLDLSTENENIDESVLLP